SPAVEDHAFVRLVCAREALGERGLAAPVLADERVDLAGAEPERDAVERTHAGERLHEVADLPARLPAHGVSCASLRLLCVTSSGVSASARAGRSSSARA